MDAELTRFQKQLCDVLQDGLPLCPRPFAAIAASLETDEPTVLAQAAALRDMGVIRRLGPIIDYRALGRCATLVTAHVPDTLLEKVAAAVSANPSVSHNYLRRHHFNLWFTLQGPSPESLDRDIAALCSEFILAFHSLPALATFKLDVRFNLSGRPSRPSVIPPTDMPPVTLTAAHKAVLQWLQGGIQITAEPFAAGPADAIAITETLLQGGVIKRIAATLNYRSLGFTANAMFCCKVDQARIEPVGRALAAIELVSHCYQRRTFDGWPWNLFAMMHARRSDDIDATVLRFAQENAIPDHILLPTVRELKKSPVRHVF